MVNVIVKEGAILALVQHLQAPPVTEEDLVQKLLPFEHEVEKGSAFALGLLAGKVLSSMRMLMVEDSNNAQNDSFLLDDSSRENKNLTDFKVAAWGLAPCFCNECVMTAMYEYGSSSEPSFSTATQDSSADDDFSTEYLQDALLEFGDRSKRRRLLPNVDNHHDQQYSKTSSSDLEKSLWNLNPTYCMSQNIESIFGLSDEDIISTFWSRIMREEAKILVEEETTTSTNTILSGEMEFMYKRLEHEAEEKAQALKEIRETVNHRNHIDGSVKLIGTSLFS
ncbi:ARM REPEAT PROTEIN INTERACTING WITH [Arachis hypogaea]|nr:ARM REPEAT PROTEIN INTERACTING WITH [Arachis hypogaea]